MIESPSGLPGLTSGNLKRLLQLRFDIDSTRQTVCWW